MMNKEIVCYKKTQLSLFLPTITEANQTTITTFLPTIAEKDTQTEVSH